jgi:NADP-dependent aldehyde dehydrogenase
MTAGVFALLHGWSHETGLAMVRHPLCRAVGFTGSLRAGRALFDAAAARPEPIPVYAEMGSVNPVFVFPSALANPETAALLAQSVTLGVGQFCTNPGIIAAPRDDRFRDELAQRITAAGPGVPLYQQLGAAFDQAVTRAAELGAQCVGPTDSASKHMQPQLLVADLATFVGRPELRAEMFGPASILVTADVAEFRQVADVMDGQLTATVFASTQEIVQHAALMRALERKVGRLIFNGVPTGVEVSHAMQHGGPYPASTDARSTSVGSAAITRFARPVCYQNFPEEVLPPELQAHNPLRIWRLVDGQPTRDPL